VIVCRRSRLGLAILTAALLGVAGCGGSSAGNPSTGSGTSASTAPASSTSIVTTSTQRKRSSLTVSASSGAGRLVTASAGGVTATMRGSTHKPKVERSWPLHFTVSRGGHAVRASVSYEYLFAGQVVAHRDRYTFAGHFSDIFRWPAAAVGYPLTFRAVIVSAGVTINLEYPVQVSA
jgi:hypothetical protein